MLKETLHCNTIHNNTGSVLFCNTKQTPIYCTAIEAMMAHCGIELIYKLVDFLVYKVKVK